MKRRDYRFSHDEIWFELETGTLSLISKPDPMKSICQSQQLPYSAKTYEYFLTPVEPPINSNLDLSAHIAAISRIKWLPKGPTRQTETLDLINEIFATHGLTNSFQEFLFTEYNFFFTEKVYRKAILKNFMYINKNRQAYPRYLDKLLAGSSDNYSSLEELIDLDIHRTNASDLEKLLLAKILKAYSRRNPVYGYLQGFNFVIHYFLKLFDNSIEDTFWAYTHIIESGTTPSLKP
jgi:hypothetical protein